MGLLLGGTLKGWRLLHISTFTSSKGTPEPLPHPDGRARGDARRSQPKMARFSHVGVNQLRTETFWGLGRCISNDHVCLFLWGGQNGFEAFRGAWFWSFSPGPGQRQIKRERCCRIQVLENAEGARMIFKLFAGLGATADEKGAVLSNSSSQKAQFQKCSAHVSRRPSACVDWRIECLCLQRETQPQPLRGNWSTGFLDYIIAWTPGGFRVVSEMSGRTKQYFCGFCRTVCSRRFP